MGNEPGDPRKEFPECKGEGNCPQNQWVQKSNINSRTELIDEDIEKARPVSAAWWFVPAKGVFTLDIPVPNGVKVSGA